MDVNTIGISRSGTDVTDIVMQSVPECATTTQADNSGGRGVHPRVWWKIVIGKQEIEFRAICAVFTHLGKKFVFQEELSPEGFEHYQCLIQLKRKTRKAKLIKDLATRLHCEVVNISASPSDEAFSEYYSKLETRVNGPWSTGFSDIPSEPVKVLEYASMYGWQKEVYDQLKEEPDDRSIFWYWDPQGASGKTALAKSIVLNFGAFIFRGKSSDIANRIIQMPTAPKICIMNVSRSMEQYVSYQAIEEIKDGMLESGKYEGGQKIFNPPHVIIFANFPPKREMLSEDRWKVKLISKLGDSYTLQDDDGDGALVSHFSVPFATPISTRVNAWRNDVSHIGSS